MRNTPLSSFIQRCILCISLLFPCSKLFASHIVGADLYYTQVSGLTYKITLVLYGDCGPASAAVFASLSDPATHPQICIYNGSTLLPGMPFSLSSASPLAGTEITPVCPGTLTQCTSTALPTPGIKKFVYTGTYTLPYPSTQWRFVFNGAYGTATAGRAAAITNITGGTTIQLVDTLDNSTVLNNSNPIMTIIPTPFFCLNHADGYNPGAVDPDGDNLVFTLVHAPSGTGTCTPGGLVTYTGTAWPSQPITATTPLRCVSSSYSFDATTGQILFNPNFLQRAVVVYNIREFRGGVFVGSCQREMTFLVLSCLNIPPSGIYNSATAGSITDTTHFRICSGMGPFSIFMNPTDPEGNNITVTASGLPAGATFTTTGNGTTTPHSTFSWTTTGVSPGVYVFFVTFTDDNCPESGTMTRAFTVTIDPAPMPITGTFTVCAGATTTLADATPGGTWSSSSPSIATVGPTGIVTGVSSGTAIISYNLPFGCVTTATVTVNPISGSSIVGPTSVCVGSTITLTNPVPGGTWSTPSSTVSVSSSGVVTGVSVGTALISYTTAGLCGATSATYVVTVGIAPTVSPITGPTTVCVTSSITLANATAGGVWSSGSSNASVSSGGVVSGITSGTATISYSVSNSCGTVYATKIITVNPLPAAGTITGPGTVCVGSTITLSGAPSGGTWAAAPTSVATVSPGGVVSGVAAGTATISYSISNSCGTTVATTVVTVNTLPAVAAITGPSSVCSGSTITLSSTTPGGIWSSSGSAATVSSTGIVTGVSAGTATISYTVSNSCGTAYALQIVTVDVFPTVSAITGPSTVCVGATITLASTTPGGVWSSTTPGIASITSGGVVTGVSGGTTTISYTVTNSCGTAAATTVITVNTLPTVAAITGPSSVCAGSTITLSSTTPGGTWSSSGIAATVGPTGIVTGVSAGTATISYSVSNSCGTVYTTKIVTVDIFPTVSAITGPSSVCVGATITLANTTPGGAWSSTIPGVASISSGGVITGISGGTTTISYTITNSCGSVAATTVITVNPLPTVAPITGPTSVCVGATITLSNTTTGGTWSSTGGATVGSTGIVTGTISGTATISYTVFNSCGSVVATMVITVNPLPVAGTISGTTTVCAGLTTTLTASVAGGTWSSGSPNASVSAAGVVTGITAGTAIISYSVSNICGTAVATTIITVDPLPVAAPVTGPGVVCAGASITLSSTSPGGTWSSSTTTVATVSSGGVVTGISGGTATITYSVTNSCGTATAMAVITVNPLPTVAPITGPGTVCVGLTITLSCTTAGGTWASSGSATVGSTGIVTGVSGGTATISYSVSNSCGTTVVTTVITVNVFPNPGVISGPTNVCEGGSITLSETVPGGTWSSGSTNATVSSSGVVTGVTAGTATISYTVTNSCGSVYATYIITVNPTPAPGTITGPNHVCQGSTITLSNTVTGGVWSSSSSNATISTTGVVTGVTPGTATISYTVTLGLCSSYATYVVTVDMLPNAGTISGGPMVCTTNTILMTDPVTGGTWSCTPPNATITSTGLLTGIAVGTAIVSYTVSNICGTAVATKVVTINLTPDPGTISGPDRVCAGSNITLTASVSGGTWTSSNPAIASITTTGSVHGYTAGTAVITYTVSNIACIARVTKVITVDPLAVPGSIGGGPMICAGDTITLTSTEPGGVWSISGTAATLSSTGVLTSVTAGTVIVSYTVTNICGPATATKMIIINPLPDPGTITAPHTICLGNTISLSAGTVNGGTWQSSNTAVATVDAVGTVIAVSIGTTIITYKLTSSLGCSSTITHMVTVSPAPPAGVISSPPSICILSDVQLTETEPGGTWSCSDASIAVINSNTGLVHATAPGVIIITYTIAPNGSGCSGIATYLLTIMANSPIMINEKLTDVLCNGGSDGSITVFPSGGTGPWHYVWNTGATTASVSGLAPGNYNIDVVDETTKCHGKKDYTIKEPTTLDIIPDVKNDECHMANGAITLAVKGGTSPFVFRWYDNSMLDHVAGLLPGTYSVDVTDNNQCRKSANIDVIEGDCDNIDVHNGFSPNNDGINDYWIIYGLENYPNNLVQLFDKWGDKIFEQKGYDNKWNGHGLNGSEVPDGTYFYIIKLNADNGAGGKNVLTGSLLIKR